MSSESVTILIEADDKATDVLQKAANEAKMVKAQIDGMGNSFKSTGDIVSRAAKVMGGGWLVNAANDIKAVGELASKSKDIIGGLGATSLLAKAGLIGLAAAGGIAVGKMLGDFIFQTARWKKEMEEALAVGAKLNTGFADATRQRVSDESREIELVSDPEERSRLKKEQLTLLAQEQASMKKSIKQDEQSLQYQKTSLGAMLSFGLAGKANRQLEQKNIDSRKEHLAVITAQVKELQKQASPAEAEFEARKKSIEQTKAAIALQQQLSDEILRARNPKLAEIEIAKRVTENKEEQRAIEALIRKRQAIDDNAKARANSARIAREDQKDAERQAQKRTQENLKALDDAKSAKADVTPNNLQGRESRFLSRSTNTFDLQRQQFESMKRQEAIAKASQAVAADMLANLKTIATNLGVPDEVWGGD